MGSKLPVLNYNITLSDDASVHAQKALRYLFTDTEAIKHTSFMFNILVNNADFYSGTCYTDGGNTAWGDINKRGSEADPGSVWKWVTYNFKTGGADPVLKKLGSPDFKALDCGLVSWKEHEFGQWHHGYHFTKVSEIPDFGSMVHGKDFFIEVYNGGVEQEHAGIGIGYVRHNNSELVMTSINGLNSLALKVYYAVK